MLPGAEFRHVLQVPLAFCRRIVPICDRDRSQVRDFDAISQAAVHFLKTVGEFGSGFRTKAARATRAGWERHVHFFQLSVVGSMSPCLV